MKIDRTVNWEADTIKFQFSPSVYKDIYFRGSAFKKF